MRSVFLAHPQTHIYISLPISGTHCVHHVSYSSHTLTRIYIYLYISLPISGRHCVHHVLCSSHTLTRIKLYIYISLPISGTHCVHRVLYSSHTLTRIYLYISLPISGIVCCIPRTPSHAVYGDDSNTKTGMSRFGLAVRR